MGTKANARLMLDAIRVLSEESAVSAGERAKTVLLAMYPPLIRKLLERKRSRYNHAFVRTIRRHEFQRDDVYDLLDAAWAECDAITRERARGLRFMMAIALLVSIELSQWECYLNRAEAVAKRIAAEALSSKQEAGSGQS